MPALRQSFLIVAHCLTAVLVGALPAAAQMPNSRYERPSARVVEFGDLKQQTVRRVAIIGDVERPGVYESSAKRLVAGTVLEAAGSNIKPGYFFTRFHAGLTKQERPVMTASSEDLVNGDVLVASVPQSRFGSQSKARIYVAVIGLMPDPVVIRIPESDRSLPGLFTRLNQGPLPAADAKVNGVKSTELLNNGDVVVVESHLINRAALMGCEGMLPPQSLDKAPEPEKATTEWSPPPFVPQSEQLPPAPPPIGERVPLPEVLSALPPMVESRDEALADSVEPVASTSTTVATAYAAPAEQHSTRESRLVAEVPRRQDISQTSGGPSAAVDADAKVRNLVILMALGTLGVGIALLWVASERRLKGVPAPEPVELKPAPVPTQSEVVEKDDLGELIRGELEIQDEPVVLPSRVALHGQAVGQKRLVIHPPQALAGPHFGPSAPAAEKVATVREASPVSSGPVAPASPVRSVKDTEGLLDRVLLAMQREGRR